MIVFRRDSFGGFAKLQSLLSIYLTASFLETIFGFQ